ncbi:MAG: iron ABC transporter substrate-binding protein [Chloroflexota bacterium]
MRRMRISRALVAALAGVLAVTLVATALASPFHQDVTLVLYNAQHVPLAEAWVNDFKARTGINVEIRSGRDLDLANQLIQEGSGSPADLFITENSPGAATVGQAGLFAKVDPATLAQVPSQYASPNGDWVGIAARTTVFVYNPSLLSESDLPRSIMDLAKPEWKDRFGIAPAGADFQAIVSAVLQLKGPDETAAWLQGLKTNAKIYSGNRAIMSNANTGEVSGGVICHYYWYGDRAESGANSSNVELHYFLGKDPGGFISVSGGGVLASSKHPVEAQQFLAYMTSPAGQQILSTSNALEYSIASNVPPHPSLKPLSELDPPLVDISKLNAPSVVNLMRAAGLL